VLVYYYTSLEEAKVLLRSDGIPALKLNPRITSLTLYRPKVSCEGVDFAIGDRGGVVVSTKAPYELTPEEAMSLQFMNPTASSKEAVLCLSLPRALLWSLEIKSDTKVSLDTPVRFGTSLDSVLQESSKANNDGDNSNNEGEDSSALVAPTATSIRNANSLNDIAVADKLSNANLQHLRILPVELLEAIQDVDLTPKKRRSSGGGGNNVGTGTGGGGGGVKAALALKDLIAEDEAMRSGLGLLMLNVDKIMRTFQVIEICK
jgi:hypothetical protein